MAVGKKRTEPADEWLIDPADRPPEPAAPSPKEFTPDEPELSEGQSSAESIGAETAQWIVPAARPNGGAAEETRGGRRAPKAADKRAASKRSDAKKRLQRAEKALEKQREENADLTERIQELEDRVEELEADLADAKKEARAAKPAATPRQRATASRPATRSRARAKSAEPAKSGAAESGRAKRTSAKNGKLDLNGATFEELRNLGLSVTQSARMIAYRDVRGGFGSLDELDDIPGLSAETRRDLKGRLELGS